MLRRKHGNSFKFSKAELVGLRQRALDRPTDSLKELSLHFAERFGRTIRPETVAKGLARAGVVRVKPGRMEDGGKAEKDRHRFTAEHRREGPEGGYPSSLTDHEWGLVRDLFEQAGAGRPAIYERRRMLDACCYVVRSGCPWRLLPKDLPKWEDVYATFRRWTAQGRFEQMHARLAAKWRERAGKKETPSAAILDSQSVRTSPQGGPSGIDANKKIKGRKRHLVTDMLGLVLAAFVTAASVQDPHAARPVVDAARKKHPSIRKLFVDTAYAGKCAQDLRSSGLDVEVVRRPDQYGIWATRQMEIPTLLAGFNVLPKRWVIERTNAWISHARRLARDYDRLTSVSSAWIWLVESKILLRRLT